MTDAQKAGASASLTGRAYNLIAPIYESLPQRFTTKDVITAARIPHNLQGAAKRVLSMTFRCSEVGEVGATWKKP